MFGTPSGNERPVAYIGQAGIRKNGEGILARLQEHDKNPDKDYWTEAVVITTKDDSFGPTELSYLENRFCNFAIKADRYTVKNANDPTPGNITEEKESELEEFADFVQLILGVLGYKVFEPKDSPNVQKAPKPQVAQKSNKRSSTKTIDKPIGKFAQKELTELLQSGRVPLEEAERLTSLSYCKDVFGKRRIYYPILVEWPSGVDRKAITFLSGKDRYYSRITIEIGGKRFLLSSEWYKETIPYLLAWYEKYI